VRCLRKARKAARCLKAAKHECHKLTSGIRRVYAEGRGALRDSKRHPDAEHLHLLRKRSKYLYLQLKMVAAADSSPLGRAAALFHTLWDVLGDDPAPAALRERVAGGARALADGESQTRLLTAIAQRRTALRRKALLRADRLFRDELPRFARSLQRAATA